LIRDGEADVALAGGVFANVKINQRVHEVPGVESVFVYPAMSDEGIAAGAALTEWARNRPDSRDYCEKCFDHVYLGPEFSESEIAGALEAAALDPGRVIVGEEIMTREGELLAYFVHEEVPPGLAPAEAIERLRSQGAFISVSHPFDRLRSGSWEETGLRRILPLVDGVEVFNARTWSAGPDRRAAALAEEVGLLGTVGSDAHAYAEVGRAVLRTRAFDDSQGLRRALREAQIHARRSSPLVHLLSRYAAWRKAIGWRPSDG
jgi:hypothetical protein